MNAFHEFVFINLSFLSSLQLVLVGFIVIYLIKIWRSYQFFKERGIKTPKYLFIIGNLDDLRRKSYSNQLKEWTEQLGPVYGYFEGHLPVIVTSDLEIINEVFIKQFSSFVARKRVPLQARDSDEFTQLGNAVKLQWKRLRNVTNPTFSAAKLKQLLPLINKISNRFLDVIESNEGKEINVSKYLDRFTMDTIFNCAFGIDIECQKNYENKFFVKAVQFFKITADFNPFFIFNTLFYELKFLTVPLMALYSKVFSDSEYAHPFFWLVHQSHQVLEKRVKENIHKNDYLQLLIDSQSDEFKKEDNQDDADYKDKKIEKKLTFDELKMGVVVFLLAGYETTSTALSYCFYCLAKYPEELTKLQDEIDSAFGYDSNIEITYDNINKLEYMDMFIKEVLRMYPIGTTVIQRRCTKETTIKGIYMPVGTCVAADVLSIHYSSEHWGPVDPNEFCPERHSSKFKRNPLCYLPFGIGPRQCVGMRFALLEIKLTLVKLLKNFNIERGKETPEQLNFIEGFSVRRPKGGVSVIFKKRAFIG